MKKIIFTFGFFFALLLNVYAQNDSIPHSIEQQKAAKKLAANWLSMFYQVNDTDSLMKISKTPFLLDGKEVINSNEKLIAVYNGIIEDKGKLESPEIKAEIYNEEYTLTEEFPLTNFLPVILAITEKDTRTQHLLVFVEVDGDNYKISGFDD